jgi:GDPmannose 4,6-dehydratase|tara:strand:+ start:18147 stop:19121 length:975 start_codon:yes stop_codon:yes gene_type:complete
MKTALITGVTGQDGSYLAELLLSKGYQVIGAKRRTSLITTDRVDRIYDNPNFHLAYFDLNDTGCIYRLLNDYLPDEIYNLAAQSHVRVSFDIPENTVDGIALGALRILDAIRNIAPLCKFYQASSSEMYGDNPNYPFNEDSRMTPASPYACAKLFSHNLVRNYRESYNLHASSGILFNHESPRRGETFVTRKITRAAARIKLGLQDKLYLGNLSAKRDWGFAGDYVEAMWLMLQQEIPGDYVIATGESRSVKEFLDRTFEIAGLEVENHVEIDSRFFRPHEVPYLLGDSSKARKELAWEPKTSFEELVRIMYESDYDVAKKDFK